MVYDITNLSNVTKPTDLLVITNNNAGGWLFFGLNVMLFFILFLSQINFGLEVALLSSAFITLVIGLLLAYLGLMAWWLVGVWVGVILLTIIYLMWNSRYN